MAGTNGSDSNISSIGGREKCRSVVLDVEITSAGEVNGGFASPAVGKTERFGSTLRDGSVSAEGAPESYRIGGARKAIGEGKCLEQYGFN